MRVEVRDDAGDLVWAFWTNEFGRGGVSRVGYRTDGTLERIIAVIDGARQQAVSELHLSAEGRCGYLRPAVDGLFRGFIGQWVRRHEVRQ